MTLVIALGIKPITVSYLLSPESLFNDFLKPLALQHEVLANKITEGTFLKEANEYNHRNMCYMYFFNIGIILDYIIKSSMNLGFAKTAII